MSNPGTFSLKPFRRSVGAWTLDGARRARRISVARKGVTNCYCTLARAHVPQGRVRAGRTLPRASLPLYDSLAPSPTSRGVVPNVIQTTRAAGTRRAGATSPPLLFSLSLSILAGRPPSQLAVCSPLPSLSARAREASNLEPSSRTTPPGVPAALSVPRAPRTPRAQCSRTRGCVRANGGVRTEERVTVCSTSRSGSPGTPHMACLTCAPRS